ncbi:hypothetical protein [Pararobbsia silviterrae]|uniref:Uncharacterized protein n=1 Tax=Pararobbsia silviterrae TaxID=1792498 RepID=A0A494X8Q5_9BURK|nr:hypothetical protein [Pararobbsia silviterrae]RKP44766.1 hypothetical protein D7S86_27495 [Pararobbsia silviterrae]
MSVAEASERLAAIAARARARRETRLVVPFDPGFASVGGTPAKNVVSIHEGFDWDAGKVFIEVGTPRLFAPTDAQERLRKTLERAQNTIACIGFALRSRASADGKLRIVKHHFDEYAKPVKLFQDPA